MLGVPKPSKGGFYTSQDINEFEILGQKFENPSYFPELNNKSTFSFDVILPINALPKTTSDDKLINIFLLVKPGLKAP